ncbi:hypothetical protein [Bacillus sp. OAE603]|uniref:hypothetical protein n=1 Tax=Gottfriedia sp. OAE603 TaxID=2663872 RepID=UPI00178A31A4
MSKKRNTNILLGTILGASIIFNGYLAHNALANDNSPSVIVSVDKWKSSNVTYDFDDNTWPTSFDYAVNESAAGTGLKGWNANSGIFLGYSSSSNNDWLYGPADSLAVTLCYSDASHNLTEVNTTINSSYSWYTGLTGTPSSTQYDLKTVALHEMGHWHRLLDTYLSTHSSYVMYGYTNKGQVKRSLTSFDTEAAKIMYGPN